MLDVWLKPGEIFFGKGEYMVTAVLGACVSAVIWHPQLKLGGICHVILPRGRRSHDSGFRFANNAVGHFVDKVYDHNTLPSEYMVGLYGGAELDMRSGDADAPNYGRRNIERMECLLVNAGFHIGIKDIGCGMTRNIKFNVTNGDLVVDYIESDVESGVEVIVNDKD